MKGRIAALTAAALLVGIVTVAPAASAQTEYTSYGTAVKDGALYEVSVHRFPAGGNICVTVTVADMAGNVVAQDTFQILDDYDESAPTAAAYTAASDDPGVDFALDGAQTSGEVSATGHFEGYELTVTVQVLQ